jgi:hypothetical protein
MPLNNWSIAASYDTPVSEVGRLVLVWAHKAASAAAPRRGKAMAQIYRDVAINQMIATTEEAMSHAIDWWGDLPTSMNEAIDKFRVQLGAAIDSVEFVKKALDRPVPETSWKATEQR